MTVAYLQGLGACIAFGFWQHNWIAAVFLLYLLGWATAAIGGGRL